MPVTRRTYGVLAAASAVFLAYGSLVPFSFAWRPFDQAVASFMDALTSPMFIASRTDFVTNILLTVPLTYALVASVRTDRRGWLGDAFAGCVAFVLSVTLSFLVEFAQNFFPGRTDSLSDIVAQTIGAVIGVVLWLLVGRAVTEWLRETFAERSGAAFGERVVLAYCVVFVLSQWIPLDLTINLAELAQKYRRGGILLVPFTWAYTSMVDRLWDYAGDIALNVPIGAAAVLVWTADGYRRAPLRASAIAVAAVALIELGQVFVNSRIADMTDVLTGSIGALIGVAGVTALSRQTVRTTGSGRPQVQWWACAGLIVMTMLLASYHWKPFNFTFEPERVRVGMRQLLSPPLGIYYVGTEFNAFTEMTRKMLLALPLGVLLHFAWPAGRSYRRVRFFLLSAIGCAIAFGLELGQVFLPTRVPDTTDVILAELGIVGGLWLTGRISRRTADEASTARASAVST